MKIINRRVAIEPFEKKGATAVVNKGVVQFQEKGSLTKLRVVYDMDDGFLRAGDHIYVRGDMKGDQRFRSILVAEDGTQFVLVPIELVEGVERQA